VGSRSPRGVTPTNSCPAAKGADLSHPRRAIRARGLAARTFPRKASRGRAGSEDIDTSNRRTMSLVLLIKKRQDSARVAASSASRTTGAARLPFGGPVGPLRAPLFPRPARLSDVKVRRRAICVVSTPI